MLTNHGVSVAPETKTETALNPERLVYVTVTVRATVDMDVQGTHTLEVPASLVDDEDALLDAVRSAWEANGFAFDMHPDAEEPDEAVQCQSPDWHMEVEDIAEMEER